MNDPTLAIRTPDIALSSEEFAGLLDICQRTLARRPEISPWIRHIQLPDGKVLPFLPIRCFRLLTVSNYSDAELSSKPMILFRSSGSTNDVRASHVLGPSGWESYKDSVTRGYLDAATRLGISTNTPIISLVPPRGTWPESSLAAMISLWQENGLDISYVDVESKPEELATFFNQFGTQTKFQSCVIFGTSIHHLIVAHWHRQHRSSNPFIHAKHVYFFDTGGTKGRTVSTGPEQLHAHMSCWVNPSSHAYFFSEYGMCELSSQAYSFTSPHNSTFNCSPTLRSLIIAPDFKTIRHSGDSGFLAFIDTANVDSWPFILTEDLGESVDDSCLKFRLLGRAPDSTIKGCSLNVKTNFRFDLSNLQSQVDQDDHMNIPLKASQAREITANQRTLFEPQDLLSRLNAYGVWTRGALDDLSASLQNWRNPEAESELQQQLLFENELIAITASANIPITWLFPTTIAWLSGAQEIALYLPSVRQEDPISALVREQIKTLADAFNQCARESFIRILDNRLPTAPQADRVLIFGSDSTIGNIKNALSQAGSHARVIGLGHFQNSLHLADADFPEDIAMQTSHWLGRGCLTPLLAIAPDSWTHNMATSFARSLTQHAAARFEKYLPSKSFGVEFAHKHNLAEFEAVAHARAWQNISVLKDESTGVVCVNLIGKNAEEVAASELAPKLLDWGGCGWLTLTSKSAVADTWANLALSNPCPTLWEPHQGKVWTDWLSEQ